MATYRNDAVYDDIARCVQIAILSCSSRRNFNVIAVALFRYFTQRRLLFATRRRVQRPLCNCTPHFLQHLDSFISKFFATFAHKFPPAYNNEVQLTFPFSGKSSRDRS